MRDIRPGDRRLLGLGSRHAAAARGESCRVLFLFSREVFVEGVCRQLLMVLVGNFMSIGYLIHRLWSGN